MSTTDIEAAISQLVGVTPGKQFTAGEVVARGLERGITGSIRGAAQLLGEPSATVAPEDVDPLSAMQGTPLGEERTSLATPTETQLTDLQKEAQYRIMSEQRGFIAPAAKVAGSILDPFNLLPVGRVATAAQGALKFGGLGAASGLLEPTYAEDTVTGNVVAGALGGTVLGAAFGKLVSKYGSEAVEQAMRNGATTEEEIEAIIKPHIKLKSTPEQASVVEDVTKPRIQLKSTPEQATPYQAIDTEAAPVMDSIQPLLDGIGDPVQKEAIVLSIANGDYTKLFNLPAFKDVDVPLDRIVFAFGENNPNRIQNMDSFVKSRLSGRQESEQLLGQVYTALQTRLSTNLGKMNRVDLPEDLAVSGLLDRKVQEVLSADVVNAFIPAVRKAKDDLFALNDLMNTLEGSGMTRREAAAMLAPDFNRAESILTAALGNASNTGLALQALKKQAAVLGSTKNILNKVMSTQGDSIDRLLALSDSFKTIDGTLEEALDKTVAKNELLKNALREPNWKDKAGEYVVNAFISGLATPVVNVASAGFKVPAAIATRFVQGFYPGSGVGVRESGAMLHGVLQGLLEGTAFAKQGFVSGLPIDSTTEFKKSIGGKLGEVVRVPTKVGVGADEWAKAVFRRMEWNALSNRVAYSGRFAGKEAETYNLLRKINLGDAGRIDEGKTSVASWAKTIMDQAEGTGIGKDEAFRLAEQVAKYAKQQTFQEEFAKGTMANNLLKFRSQHPELAFIIPFVKTPLNIMKDALSYMGAQYIPGMYKGMSKDEKFARLAVGSAFVAALGSKVADGTLTGSYSRDAGKRNAAIASGIPEYSIKIGDTWYSYARVEPIATVLGTTVDGIRSTAEYFAKNPKDRKVSELATDLVGGFTKNIASKTFLEGISNLLQAAHDPDRYGGSFINGFAGLVVPSFVAAPARSADPSMRVVTNFSEAVQNRLPGFRQDLPAQSMIYGGERPNPSQGLTAFTGIQTAPAAQTALQQEATRVKLDYDLPSKTLKNVDLKGEEIGRYQALSSQYADLILGQIIENPAYQSLPDSRKKVVLENGLKRARSVATRIMFSEKIQDPDFKAEFIRKKLQKKGIIEDEGEE
jgi:hypothetical protein